MQKWGQTPFSHFRNLKGGSVPSKIKGRTKLDFQTGADVWSTIDQWAQEYKFELRAQDEASRLYQKGQNLSLIHISEPTRLGMISYAVFCLKQKKKKKKKTNTNNQNKKKKKKKKKKKQL